MWGGGVVRLFVCLIDFVCLCVCVFICLFVFVCVLGGMGNREAIGRPLLGRGRLTRRGGRVTAVGNSCSWPEGSSDG